MRTAALALLAACSSSAGGAGSDTTFPEEILQTMACDSLDMGIRTAPAQPPTAGLDGVEVVLTDAKTRTPIEGASISLVPWMPLMGHGADVTPMCTPKGKGHYVCTNVALFMPGEWQLRFQVSSRKVACSAAPTFNVP